MDFFGNKTQKLLTQAQELLRQAQNEMTRDIDALNGRQDAIEQRLAHLEVQRDEDVTCIRELQQAVDDIRDSAIRGEIASGQKSLDVAKKFGISPARVSQIAPRRRYNNG